MDFEEHRNGDVLTLKVNLERIDTRNATDFRQNVKDSIQDDDHSLVLDFSRVSYLSSSGLRVLLILARDMKDRGGAIALENTVASVRDVIVISGFDKILELRD